VHQNPTLLREDAWILNYKPNVLPPFVRLSEPRPPLFVLLAAVREPLPGFVDGDEDATPPGRAAPVALWPSPRICFAIAFNDTFADVLDRKLVVLGYGIDGERHVGNDDAAPADMRNAKFR